MTSVGSRSKRALRVAILAVIAAVAAAACGSTSKSTSSPTTTGAAGATSPVTPQTVTLSLDWTPNTNHTGFYVADKLGYYKAAGIKLKIIPYSTTAPDTLVGTGKADFGISFQDATTFDVAAGEPVTSVMAILQHTATEIAYKANRPDIKTPKDLDGKTYAGFGQPYEVPTLQTVIKNAGGTGKFKVVTLNTASYEAVYKGVADFTIPFVAWEGIQAGLLHQPLSFFKFSDYGFPDFYQVVLIANNNFLAADQSLATRFVQASAKGFTYAAQNPSSAAKILIDANPGVFNLPELVYDSANMLARNYYLDASGKFGTQTLAEWTGYSSFLYKHGLLVDAKGKPITSPPDYASLFTDRYLDGT